MERTRSGADPAPKAAELLKLAAAAGGKKPDGAGEAPARLPLGRREAPEGGTAQALTKQLKQLWAVRPDLKGQRLPQEVALAYLATGDLFEAVAEYEAGEKPKGDDETQKLRRENALLRQRAEAARQAPVRGTTDYGTQEQGEDPMIQAFRNAPW